MEILLESQYTNKSTGYTDTGAFWLELAQIQVNTLSNKRTASQYVMAQIITKELVLKVAA